MKSGAALEEQLKRKYKRPVIDCYELTSHATRRMLERGIHADWIREALTWSNGRAGTQPNTFKYVGPRAMVTLNLETREIITVGYGFWNDPLLEVFDSPK
jgi:hypothetical protein